MIDANLQSQLREKFNPEGSMLRRQQLRMLEILLYIDKVCKEHNITYWLSSGSLLGAVRHGGFIPWDDDLDIEMLREDYEKFIKVFPNNEDFVLQTHKNDRNYLLPFAKVRDLQSELDEFGHNATFKYKGLFVDVFCLEMTPRFAYVFYGGLFYLLQKMQHSSSNCIIRELVVIFKNISYLSIALFRPILRIFPHKKLNHIYGSGPRWKSRDRNHIFPLKEILFEEHKFPVPFAYDSYLYRMYGDFNKLPNLNKLRIHCRNCIFFNQM